MCTQLYRGSGVGVGVMEWCRGKCDGGVVMLVSLHVSDMLVVNFSVC